MYVTLKREDLLRSLDRRRSTHTKLEATERHVLLTRRFGAPSIALDALVTIAEKPVIVVRTHELREALLKTRPRGIVSLRVVGGNLTIGNQSVTILGNEFPDKEIPDGQADVSYAGLERRLRPNGE